ncbi:tRNA preQ1(34) S-adenosylmethionine ribosyltransferase-isomerase QueA [Candidatus Peregrinibacteria bacterium]|nr:tRNA preQ1(34) S-adenosylmethionine ribosyltransferase-isomerase QueA [Candidatus Peregrinibacteria bacterium]
MKTSDFDYKLPQSLIAQNPAVPRDSCRLMVYRTATDEVLHCHFYDLLKFLTKDDVLVINKSKVVPARILFNFKGAKKEIFILKEISNGVYEVLLKPAKFFKLAVWIQIDGDLECFVEKIFEDGRRLIKFRILKDIDLRKKLLSLGTTPLPPYIKNSKAELSDYQTVYADMDGSKAAPTAGLHFTKSLLKKIKSKGVEIEEVLLHVGLGTFAQVAAENPVNHKMHFEEFELSGKTEHCLNHAVNEHKRIIAVGTTSVRVLESVYNSKDGFLAGKGNTDIFIYPGCYHWKIVDGLITNFHLPKSTLMMLVASFLESRGIKKPVKKILELYNLAIQEKYRFFSFGDAMLII